ncbi:hypothetical protein F2Q70_00041411 [Brassica cretica]|uniref:Uncharacterized protein n=1 Tax=Brassica cretica TaxID=69181 RepID=A0A8S9K3A3_BRACR|nr:hypothetical protein F2Q70_00041411 [Brassica cretica]
MAATKMVFHHMVLIFHSFKGFYQMVLIFHLDMFYRYAFDIYVFQIWIRLMGSFLGSLLKYNALEDFQEVFQMTSKKSSRRLQRSLPDDFQEVFQTTSRKSSDGVFFHIKWSLSLSL